MERKGEQVSERQDDRAERERSQRGIEAEEASGGPFVLAAEQTRMPMVFSDPNIEGNPIVYVNDAFLRMTGYGREEVLGRSYHFMMGDCTDPEAREEIEAAFAERFSAYPEVCYHRKDGSAFWAVIFIGTVPDETGGVSRQFASFVEVTRRKEDEERQRILIDELDHRVKNTLATVQSIVAQTLRGSQVGEEVRDALENRIAALARAHDLLAEESWKDVGLRSMLDRILEPFRVDNPRRFSIDGPDLRLPPKAALAFATMFNELAANAMKHGALSDGGEIDISWRLERVEEGDQLRLRWREHGGPPVEPPTRRGFGSRLIERGVARELRGEARIQYPREGVVCEIDVPLPRKQKP